MSHADAALTYASAGWFVMPIAPNSKRPASVIGKRWQKKSSRDPAQIRQWWERNPRYGVGLHVGRSAALAFDFDGDDLDLISEDGRPDLVKALRGAAGIHGTRRTGDRAHYLFALRQGEDYGNSAGAFVRYGEVRGRNGYIVVAPTKHPDGGEYRLLRTGVLKPLPRVLRECLSAAGEQADPKTPDQLASFLDAHTGDERPHALKGELKSFAAAVEAGASRHESIVRALPWAFREAIIDCYPAQRAYDELRAAFRAVKPEATSAEFDRIAGWAAAQAELADPDETRARLDRDRLPIDEDDFWSRREVLTDLRQFAHSRLVSPWAVLGCVLARVLTAVPADVVFPPTIGSHSSLNLFTALVGPSGAGKGAAASAAADWLRLDPTPHVATAGSGEGLAKVYAKRTTKGEQVGWRTAALFDVPEVDNLAALTSRNGSTLLPQLRQAWAGEPLGFAYADPTKAITICRHRYRLCLIVGVQPGRAAALLDDVDGGTPQRFIWMPTTDATLPDELPDAPPSREVRRWPDRRRSTRRGARVKVDTGAEGLLDKPVDPSELRVLSVPLAAVEAIVENRKAAARDPSVDPLDGHKLQCQLKVAAALMYLDNRVDDVTEEDWDLAADVMAVSIHTRESVAAALRARASDDNRRRGRAEGEREVAKSTVVEGQRTERVGESILRHLRDEDGQASAAVRKKIAARDREAFGEALALLGSRKQLRVEQFVHRTQRGERLWLGAVQ